jgi:hypothetical protein
MLAAVLFLRMVAAFRRHQRFEEIAVWPVSEQARAKRLEHDDFLSSLQPEGE